MPRSCMRSPTTSSRRMWSLVSQATRLWSSVCQIDHFPPHPVGVEGLPFFRRSPCMEENCRRCTEYLGGFRFPWLGTWNSLAILDLPGSDPRREWQSYYDRLGEAKLDLLLIDPLRTHWTARGCARLVAERCRKVGGTQTFTQVLADHISFLCGWDMFERF